MKKFVYQVAGFEFVDTEAFGTAWREAKVKAADLNTAVYRLVIKDGDVRQEVYLKAGCFLNAMLAEPKDIKIF